VAEPLGGAADTGLLTTESPPEPIRLIDLEHVGRRRVIGCWRVGDVLIDPGPSSCLERLLSGVDEAPRAILLTHIHLDHAAATGALVQRWPDVSVHVHRRGARHLARPEKLIDSATRLYGAEMGRLWGDILPVPESSIRALDGGEEIGDLLVAATPGHASHHVSYLHRPSGWAFVGDVAGVRIAPSEHVLMPTPPPDIDLPAWRSSLQLISSWSPTALAPTHFGAHLNANAHLARARDELDFWAELARQVDAPRFEERVAAALSMAADKPTAEAYAQAAPIHHLHLGLQRFWQTHSARDRQ
jgi:glyoxylase-like metal-dependent hydrolase (beta-lactamase superfamily II)